MIDNNINTWLKKWTVLSASLLSVAVFFPVLSLSGTELQLTGFWSALRGMSLIKGAAFVSGLLVLATPFLLIVVLKGKTLAASMLFYSIAYFLFLEPAVGVVAAYDDRYASVYHTVLDDYNFLSLGSGHAIPFFMLLLFIASGNYLSSRFPNHRFPYLICALSAVALGVLLLFALATSALAHPRAFADIFVFENVIHHAPFYINIALIVIIISIALGHAVFTTFHDVIADFTKALFFFGPLLSVLFSHWPASALELALLLFLYLKIVCSIYGIYFLLGVSFSAVVEYNTREPGMTEGLEDTQRYPQPTLFENTTPYRKTRSSPSPSSSGIEDTVIL